MAGMTRVAAAVVVMGLYLQLLLRRMV